MAVEPNQNWLGDGWSLNLVDAQTVIDKEGSLGVGDCCFSPMPIDPDDWDQLDHAPWPFHLVKPYKLSSFYFSKNTWRKPLVVMFPGREWYCVDTRAYGPNGYHGDGWSVVGDPCRGTLTVHPSINMEGRYHGYLTNNKITMNCDGRKYDPITGYQLF